MSSASRDNADATVLIVDDEEQLRELMKVALGERYRYVEAESTDTALELVREQRPAVVLLDVMLPGRSGLDVLREVRGDPAYDDVAIVVVSAWQAVDDRRAALELGADGFLGKPFGLDDLSAVVGYLVEHGR